MQITRQFLKDVKTASAMVIRFDGRHSTIDLFWRDQDRRATYSYGDSGKLRGSWHVFLFSGLNSNTNTLLDLLRVGDDIAFNVRYNGNQYSEIVGLNVHQLILRIKRFNKNGETINKIRQVVFDSQNCPTNSALHMKEGVKILPYNRDFDTKYKIS
jgi:hypothetical protein